MVHGLQENYVAYNKKFYQNYADYDLEQIPLYLEESHTKNYTKFRFTELNDKLMELILFRPPAFEGKPVILQKYPTFMRNIKSIPRFQNLQFLKPLLGFVNDKPAIPFPELDLPPIEESSEQEIEKASSVDFIEEDEEIDEDSEFLD